jgi:adenylate cyclase
VEVQKHLIGGYVDKFIGDAVMAMWGAPTDNSDHAYDALISSMAIAGRIEQERSEAASRGEHGFGVKIGLHSGIAIVGNVGSEQRYNYTGVGQTVNVASRLENLSGLYHCSVVIGPTTSRAVSDRITLRELDSVLVKGLDEPLTIYQPIARYGEETPEQARLIVVTVF